MIILGHTYAWKFLENCDIDCLDQFTKSISQALYEVTDNHYTIEEYDARTREILLRWSKGYLHGPGETNLKFPRFRFIYRASDIGGSWAAVTFKHFCKTCLFFFLKANQFQGQSSCEPKVRPFGIFLSNVTAE
jgi:hypothetical protein